MSEPVTLLPLSNSRMALLLGNVVRMLPKAYLKAPLWSVVSDLTGHGSSYSCEICKQLGFDPHQVLGKQRELKKL